MKHKYKYKSLIVLLSLSAILVTTVSYHSRTVQATSESPMEEGNTEYYRMGSAYMEIQPYSNTSGTF